MSQSQIIIACLHRRHGQDKTVLSCPCRRCKQAIIQSNCLQPCRENRISYV